MGIIIFKIYPFKNFYLFFTVARILNMLISTGWPQTWKHGKPGKFREFENVQNLRGNSGKFDRL